MTRSATLPTPARFRLTCAIATCALAPACKKQTPADPGPDLQIVSEALRLRDSDPLPRSSPFFDGDRIRVIAARGETIAFQVVSRKVADASLIIKANGVSIRSWATLPLQAKRASTAMYGASQGIGWYRDHLEPINFQTKDGYRL